MQQLLIVISSTLIPSVITLIVVIFSQLTKYKKEIIIAQKGTEALQNEVKTLKADLIIMTNEKVKLEKENMLLNERVKGLEKKVYHLENPEN